MIFQFCPTPARDCPCNLVAQGNVLPVLYGELRVGSRVVSQEISTADEGDGGQVVVIGR